MIKEQQIEMIERCQKLIKARQGDMGSGNGKIPVAHYNSPDFYNREQETLFRKFPLVMGFSSQVANPGDFFTHNHSGVPVLVTRDSEGELRAFLNVCMHRGAPLVLEKEGSGRRTFACPYHAWCYEATGKLHSLPHAHCFSGMNKADHDLKALPVEERHGLVFVCPDPDEDFDLEEYLGPLFQDLDSFGFDDFKLYKPALHQRNNNWKLQCDAALEVYHFPYLHNRTTPQGYFGNVAAVDYDRPHTRLCVPNRSMKDLEGTDPDGWDLTQHAGVLYSIFPNTGVFFVNGCAHVLITWPNGVDKSILQGGMLVPPDFMAPEKQGVLKFYYDHYWATQTEDMEIAEACQTTLGANAMTHFITGSNEFLVQHFHDNIEAAQEGDLTQWRD